MLLAESQFLGTPLPIEVVESDPGLEESFETVHRFPEVV